jgi:hypothetical protein
MPSTSLPESFDRDEPVRGSSDRSFGVVFTALFLLVGLSPLWHGRGPRYWAIVIGVAFLAIALARPALLRPLNRLWTQFGLLLHKIVNPIVMGLLFFLILTPFGLVLRMLGKDPLRRHFDRAASSYWILRTPPGPPPGTMTQQF